MGGGVEKGYREKKMGFLKERRNEGVEEGRGDGWRRMKEIERIWRVFKSFWFYFNELTIRIIILIRTGIQ